MKKLSVQEMESIINNKTIDLCTKDERDQVMNYAFGEKFMASENKGSIQEY